MARRLKRYEAMVEVSCEGEPYDYVTDSLGHPLRMRVAAFNLRDARRKAVKEAFDARLSDCRWRAVVHEDR